MTQRQFERLSDMAERQDRTISDVVRQAIIQHTNRHGQKERWLRLVEQEAER